MLLLFGGGPAIGEVMAASGASRWLADALVAQVQCVPIRITVLAAAIAASASCAFMLPVATMMRCGLVLNLVCIAVIAGLAGRVLG